MSKRIAFDVDTDDLREALRLYAVNRGVHLADLAREALFEYVRRRASKNRYIMEKLQEIL